jgi:phosphoglycerate dehydrogenase-like enzyme
MDVLLLWPAVRSELELIEEEWPSWVVPHVRNELSQAQYGSLLATVEVIVGQMGSIPVGDLDRTRRLRLIHTLGHGTDGFLTPEIVATLRERSVAVATSNSSAVPLAEFAIMAMTVLARRVIPLQRALVASGDWSVDLWARRSEGFLGGELHGSVLGILGYGNIGRELHSRAATFGMRVIALSRDPGRLAAAGLDRVVGWDELGGFLGGCDHVVLSVPLTQETRHLIDRSAVQSMRHGAYLINLSRGAVVDEEAVWQALDSGQLGGAALDVFESEDSRGRTGYPTDRPLHAYNTLLTPHYAGSTAEARQRALQLVGRNLEALRSDGPIENSIELG